MPVPGGGSPEIYPDLLATIEDLAAKLQRPVADLDATWAANVLAGATAVVQAAARQRLLFVADDTISMPAGLGSWLRLPERPVVEVFSVILDGTTLAAGTADGTYRLRSAGLWRSCGWQEPCYGPSDLVINYSHGWDLDDPALQLARGFTASLAAGAYEQPGGGAVQREQIDDYTVAYAAAAALMEASPAMRQALRQRYGLRAGMVAV